MMGKAILRKETSGNDYSGNSDIKHTGSIPSNFSKGTVIKNKYD